MGASAQFTVMGMPYDWIMPVLDNTGKVAVEIWLQSCFEKRRTFQFFYKRLELQWGMKRWTIRRMLRKLEQRGLVEVERNAGSRPRVTIRSSK